MTQAGSLHACIMPCSCHFLSLALRGRPIYLSSKVSSVQCRCTYLRVLCASMMPDWLRLYLQHDWDNPRTPQALKLKECGEREFLFVQAALRPDPKRRPSASTLLRSPFFAYQASAGPGGPSAAVSPAASIAMGAGTLLEPVPGVPSVMWNPNEAPLLSTLTGPVFR